MPTTGRPPTAPDRTRSGGHRLPPRLVALVGAALLACVPGWVLAQPGTHLVRPGDTLTGLARRYDTSVQELRRLNDMGSDLLRVGETIRLPGPQGWRVERVPADGSWSALAERTGIREATLRAANPTLREAAGVEVRVPPVDGPLARPRPGEDLIALAARLGVAPGALAAHNGLSAPYDLSPDAPLLVPEAAAPSRAGGDGSPAQSPAQSRVPELAPEGPHEDRRAAHAALRDAALAELPALFTGRTLSPPDDGFAWPLPGPPRITSRFGWRSLSVAGNRYHQGVDLGAPLGTTVRAARDGVVTRAGWLGAYGYAVYLAHDDGFETRYAHLGRVAVRIGERVVQGGEIGGVGSTGASTGPHLHFEARQRGRALDPLELLPRGTPSAPR